MFLAHGATHRARKRWIGLTARPRGHYVVDAGARKALESGSKSLLAIGIVEVAGEFEKGDVVGIRDPSGQEFARGLTNYATADAAAHPRPAHPRGPPGPRLRRSTTRSSTATTWCSSSERYRRCRISHRVVPGQTAWPRESDQATSAVASGSLAAAGEAAEAAALAIEDLARDQRASSPSSMRSLSSTQQPSRNWGPGANTCLTCSIPPSGWTISPTGQRLKAEVRRHGGQARIMGRSRQYLGLFGPIEHFDVCINRPDFGDDALASLVKKYGDRIWALDLRNTHVSDQGLRHLEGLSQIRQLTLGNYDSRFRPSHANPVSPITDAGLVHLKGLTQLMHLDLSGLPITDSGLDTLKDLPQLAGLYLSRTRIKGQGLARLKSLPTLVLIHLDGSELTDEGAGFLAGASSLQFLSVSGVPLTPKGLQALAGLPRLNQLDLTGCGLLDEEVRDIKMSKPGLKIMR